MREGRTRSGEFLGSPARCRRWLGREEFRIQWKAVLLALAVMAAAGCGLGSRNVDTPPSRGISSAMHGQRARDEPYDALPWLLEGRH